MSADHESIANDESSNVVPKETTPLLLNRGNQNTKASSSGPPWHDVFVCALAYSIATLFVLSPLRKLLISSGSKHTVATMAVWFHPARTRGNLLEVLYYTARLLSFGILVSFGASMCVKLSYALSFNQSVKTAMLVCWLSGALGTLGVLKVRANNQSFNTASSSAIIFLVSVLVREDDAQRGAVPLYQVLNYLEMVAIGAGISSISSVLLYRKTSLSALAPKSTALSFTYADMLDLVVADFGSTVSPVFAETNVKANTMLSQLYQEQKHAGYEVSFTRRLPLRDRFHYQEQKREFAMASKKISSLQRQSMHLGGMQHCASVVGSLNNADSHPSIAALRKPMRAFVSELTGFVKKQSSPLGCSENDQEHIAECLQTYSQSRDEVLQISYDKELDNSLQASSILFAHLLQDIAVEMITGTEQQWDTFNAGDESHFLELEREPSVDPAEISAAQTAKHFSQLNAALLPQRKPDNTGIGPKLWKLLRLLRKLDVRHGIRVSLGAFLLSLPAFMYDYRPIFQRWHGEWAIITYMIIMARNLGAMTHNIPLRIVGTTIGASVGVLANLICGKDPYALFVVGATMSFVCYRRILSPVNPVFGRFILLSYNLVCLYSYSMVADDPDDLYGDGQDPIYDIAFHRVVSVIAGVMTAVFMTVTIWPHSARQALRSNLCIQWMRIGMVWKSDPLGLTPLRRPSLTSPGDEEVIMRFRGVAFENELQSMMLDLDVLLKNSPNEFRLRGRFNPAPYKQLLESTQIILDAFHSISIIIKDDPIATPRERDLITYTNEERKELCHLLFLQFYTASASVRLGFPVPDYLPAPDLPLARLTAKINERRREVGAPNPSGSLSPSNYDFVLLYSYVTVVLTVSAELKRFHGALRDLFGSLDDEILFAYV